jgi:hypothetical protein
MYYKWKKIRPFRDSLIFSLPKFGLSNYSNFAANALASGINVS